MKKTLLASFIAASMTLGFVGGVSAADWGGAYAGASLGYSSLGGDFYDRDLNYFNGGKDDADSGDGGFFGVQAGYNVQKDNLVYGVEVDMMANMADNAESGKGNIDGWEGCPSHIFDAEMTGKGSLRGRLGMVSAGKDLFYVTGGIALAKINQRHYDCELRGTHDEVYTGWTLGVGWERMVANSVSMRVAADYSEFDKETWTDQTDERFGFEPDTLTVGASLNYHF